MTDGDELSAAAAAMWEDFKRRHPVEFAQCLLHTTGPVTIRMFLTRSRGDRARVCLIDATGDQRELDLDFNELHAAVERVVREDPDVVEHALIPWTVELGRGPRQFAAGN